MPLNNQLTPGDFSETISLESLYNELNLLDYDSLWKFFSEENIEALVVYVLKNNHLELDFCKMELVNKEIQNITTINFFSKKRYVDKLIKIYMKSDPNLFVLLHLEFQTEATKAFSERTGVYNIRLRANNSCPIITMAIIHRATAGYKHQHQFDNRKNGALVVYQGFIIAEMNEKVFEKNKCVVSQVFYSIWLYEHRKEFSVEQLIAKFLKIVKNIYLMDIKDDRYFSLLLFVLKNAQKSLSTFKNFQNFVAKINALNLNAKIMDALENWKRRLAASGRAEGKAEGRAEGRAEAKAEAKAEAAQKLVEIAKSLLKTGLLPSEVIAESTSLPLEKIKALQASLL